ncbi:uncharacterized protein PAC_13357 [Phialocephala subalpina]|uniref:Uncharacterized protein n=1 Tax=Phialocephala subalpina TaxID=576137 RepID=A0A1L7XEI5_9HELO|nr:uncharacterized protein PAC_13357 [Phialocephala subalpina]
MKSSSLTPLKVRSSRKILQQMALFENICGSAIVGGIDLAGLFPRYTDIRRVLYLGAIITFNFSWIVRPWQVVNNAPTFITTISSFSVFLAPMMGVIFCDFYILHSRKVQLSNLYRSDDSVYWYWHGFNCRVLAAWISAKNRGIYEMFYLAFFSVFFVSALVFYITNRISPPAGLGDMDEVDVCGTFTAHEAQKLDVT